MEIFKNKKPDYKKLEQFGFTKKSGIYSYKTNIFNDEFELLINISSNGIISTKLTEKSTNEPYTLHLVKYADGPFVGKIKEEYENVLQNISDKCFDNNIFKSQYTHKVMAYIEAKYKDRAEYLWPKFPNNAIYRRKESQKWYAAILTVKRNKFGFDSEEEVEVIDLHADEKEVPNLTKEPSIYPGYHMNKKHWITIILDGSLDFETIFLVIDKSYELAKK